MKKAVHGGLTGEELRLLRLRCPRIIDFSANISPLGIPPGVRKALTRVDLSCYPDPESRELREALADQAGVRLEQVVVGNGSTELIHLLARAYLGPGDAAVILAPTFGEYEVACGLAGAGVARIQAREEEGFLWDIPSACGELRRLKPRLVFLCNPNNPTGVYLEGSMVEALAKATEEGLLVLDEAYIFFVPRAWRATDLLPLGNVVVLRSMTKDYALTGLRLGYALCPGPIAEALFLHQPSWSVNAAAQAAGISALQDRGHLLRARSCVEEGRRYLTQELEALGLRVLPSAANFILVRVGDAASVRTRLLPQGICVRDCSSFGLPGHIRIAVRTIPECQELVRELKGVLGYD